MRHRETQRDTQRERERQRDRERQRETERDRTRQREVETETESMSYTEYESMIERESLTLSHGFIHLSRSPQKFRSPHRQKKSKVPPEN